MSAPVLASALLEAQRDPRFSRCLNRVRSDLAPEAASPKTMLTAANEELRLVEAQDAVADIRQEERRHEIDAQLALEREIDDLRARIKVEESRIAQCEAPTSHCHSIKFIVSDSPTTSARQLAIVDEDSTHFADLR